MEEPVKDVTPTPIKPDGKKPMAPSPRRSGIFIIPGKAEGHRQLKSDNKYIEDRLNQLASDLPKPEITEKELEEVPLIERDHSTRWNLILSKPTEGGAFAKVYLVKDKLNHDRWGRAKTLRQGKDRVAMDPDLAEKLFDMEGDVMASMHHPNIARVLDKGFGYIPDRQTQNAVPFIVVEDFSHEKGAVSLDQLVLREDKLDGDQVLNIAKGVGSAIDYAATIKIDYEEAERNSPANLRGYKNINSVVHCDIKPANIMILNGIPKVIDFGFAGALQFTKGNILGTPAFIAPEWVVNGEGDDWKPPDSRADVYSLAATMYYLLTGESPYGSPRDDVEQIFWHVATDRFKTRPLNELEGGKWYIDFFEKALAKDPNKRFQTGEEQTKAFEETLRAIKRHKMIKSVIAPVEKYFKRLKPRPIDVDELEKRIG